MAAKKKQAKTAAGKPERFIYLGPNLLKFGLQKYQVYKNGKPEAVKEIKKRYLLIEQLFAPVQDTDKLMQAIKTKGTPAYLAYEEITKGGGE